MDIPSCTKSPYGPTVCAHPIFVMGSVMAQFYYCYGSHCWNGSCTYHGACLFLSHDINELMNYLGNPRSPWTKIIFKKPHIPTLFSVEIFGCFGTELITLIFSWLQEFGTLKNLNYLYSIQRRNIYVKKTQTEVFKKQNIGSRGAASVFKSANYN